MKYNNYLQEFDGSEPYSQEYIDKQNARSLETARIIAWHRTFNAAITGLTAVYSDADTIDHATNIANRVHGIL